MVQGRADPRRDGVADYTDHLVHALASSGLETVRVPVAGPAMTVARAARELRRLRPDVVHLQFAPSVFRFSPAVGLLPDLVRVPLVTTLHEYGWWSAPSWMPARVWRALERTGRFDRETWRLAPASAAVITTNAGHAEIVARRLGRPTIRIPLAPNVHDHGDVSSRDTTRRRLGVPPDAEVVVFFGFVHPTKGVRYLIEATARMRAAGRDRLHLLVLGGFTSLALPEGEAVAFRAEIEARARACGVADHVTITGHVPAPQVSAALHAADVAAFPFTAGATTKSGALLSAFAHGLPTVVTAADPPDPELVDGETVVVAPQVRDAPALADAVARLLDEPGLRTRVGRGGAALGAARDWARIAKSHRALYAELAGRAR